MSRPKLDPLAEPGADFLAPARRADGATLASLYVASLLVIPAKLILSGIPLSLAPSDLVALLIGLFWFCAHFTTTLGVAKGHNPVRTALFVYGVATLATYGYAMAGYLPPDEVKLADHSAVLTVAMVGGALGVCDGVRGRERLDFVLKTIVVGGTFVGIVAIFQFVLNVDLTEYLVLPGLHYSADYGFVFERNAMRRVSGTTGHPIELGVLSSMLVPLCVHYAFQAKSQGRTPWRWWLCTVLCAGGLTFSVSRSAVLGFSAIGLVLFIGWPAKRRVGALLACMGFLVAMKVAVPGVLSTFYSLFANFGNDSSVGYRTHDYDLAATEIAKHFWLGRGVGTWYAPKHQVFDNQWLLTLVESGVIGAITFATVFLTSAYASLRARYLSADPDVRDLGLTMAACMVVPLVGAITFDLMSFHTVTGLMFLLVGASGSLLRTISEADVKNRHTPA